MPRWNLRTVGFICLSKLDLLWAARGISGIRLNPRTKTLSLLGTPEGSAPALSHAQNEDWMNALEPINFRTPERAMAGKMMLRSSAAAQGQCSRRSPWMLPFLWNEDLCCFHSLQLSCDVQCVLCFCTWVSQKATMFLMSPFPSPTQGNRSPW